MDVPITPSLVNPGIGSVEVQYTAGETVTAGQSAYLNFNDGRAYKADADFAGGTKAVCIGIFSTSASAGQPVLVQSDGQITIGGTVAVGTIYVVSANAGGIAPNSDSTSGWYKAILGVAITTGIIQLGIQNSGTAIP